MEEDCVYRLDPAAAETLTEQLTENLRRAIANGVFRPGDKLPGVRQMAMLCGTSVQVPIDAMKTLAEEGFVKARPRIGCIVLGKSRKVWQGRILMVHVGAYSNYGQNVFCGEVASLLGTANWRVEHFYVPRQGSEYLDLKSFAKALSEKYDLVLLPAHDSPLIEIVQDSGHPYMLLSAQVGESRGTGCIGNMAWIDSQAVVDFVAHCREADVRRVLVVLLEECFYANLNRLSAEGIEVEYLHIDGEISVLRAESFSRNAYEAILKGMVDRRTSRPDLIYFADDYLARGGLWALERLGLRVPEDIKVVSLSNYGNAPFYPRPLTRFEYNHFAYAAKTARAILRYLKAGSLPGNVLCNIQYVRGKTF